MPLNKTKELAGMEEFSILLVEESILPLEAQGRDRGWTIKLGVDRGFALAQRNPCLQAGQWCWASHLDPPMLRKKLDALGTSNI